MRRSLLRSVPVRLRHRDDVVAPDTAFEGTAFDGTDAYSTACAAAAVQLRFEANGIVTTCCRTVQPLGHIGRDRLHDIWDGAIRRDREAALETWDFSQGCQPCGAEIATEGRGPSYAAIHDEYAVGLTTDPATRAWPRRLEFNLSNSCNLQCIQCDGDSSSSIRLHREHRPPLPAVYGDQFFEDLREFLPHLDHIVFAGGEPFMASENFRVWEMIAAEAPHVTCKVVTNATQWNRRVERALEQIPFHFIFSLDGITKETYEAIRIGADFDSVMANVERFCDEARRRGTTASVNHCLMPQNHHEFGELLAWAAERDLFVNVSVVRSPASACIAQLPPDELRAVYTTMLGQQDGLVGRLGINESTWRQELGRIASWVEACDDPSEDHSSHTVMWFRAAGAGRHDDSAARADLVSFAVDGVVESIDVDGDDVIREASVSFLDPGESLVGRSLNDMTAAVVKRHGPMNHYEVLATSDDRVDARAVFGEVETRVTSLALRDDNGWADRARVLIAFGPGEADR